MGIVVQKFGGSSVADADRIRNVARAVIKEKKAGNQVVVVVSAMGKTTDYLMKLASEVSSNPDKRELDMLLTTGEQVSIAMLAMALQEEGHKAVSMNAAQIGIITENVHNKARIVDVKTEKLKAKLDEGNIVVAAGFQGVTPEGEITTLGRGGSDTSAVAIAAACALILQPKQTKTEPGLIAPEPVVWWSSAWERKTDVCWEVPAAAVRGSCIPGATGCAAISCLMRP